MNRRIKLIDFDRLHCEWKQNLFSRIYVYDVLDLKEYTILHTPFDVNIDNNDLGGYHINFETDEEYLMFKLVWG